MEVCFSDLKEKEIVNVYDGKKLGRIIDILFDVSSGGVRGIVVPGDKKLFRKNDDIFVPLEKIKKIGDDVILVSLGMGGRAYPFESQAPSSYRTASKYEAAMANERYYGYGSNKEVSKPANKKPQAGFSYVRYKPLQGKKYK